MNTLANINKLATENPQKLIYDAEKKYYNDIVKLAEQIKNNKACKIVLIAGPSGSGKTTTSHILKDKLKALGLFAEVVSLDHFYLSIDKMVLDDKGQPDFETVHSLDIPLIHHCFAELIENGKTNIPVFDFKAGGRAENTHLIDIKDNGIVIIEGLHALNPILTDKLRQDSLLKIYISINCSVFDDMGNELLTSRKMRLARRMSRDYIYRNTSAEMTLKLWTSVVAGEEKYLYCFKDMADVKLVTFHSFEPCIFKDIISELLKNLPSSAENYDYVMQTKTVLEKFVSIDCNLVPDTSLIREFIKGGIYEESK